MKYVITGCAASGTAWAAGLMTALGSPCGHEAIFSRQGIVVRDDLEGDSSWMAVNDLPSDLPVLLLIRHPLNVVRSISQMQFLRNQRYWSTMLVRSWTPDVFTAHDHLGSILRYVVQWDDGLADKPNVMPLKLEQATGRAVARAHEHLTDRPVDSAQCRRALRVVGKQVNTHGGRRSQVTWNHILDHPDGAAVAAKAKRWGYL